MCQTEIGSSISSRCLNFGTCLVNKHGMFHVGSDTGKFGQWRYRGFEEYVRNMETCSRLHMIRNSAGDGC